MVKNQSMTKTFVKSILQKHNFKPKKHLGQNFLIDETILQKIVKTADISKNDTVLEVGPGLGVLTAELAKKAKKVIAVEKDAESVKILKQILKDYKNIELIQGDILKIDLSLQENYKIVANIPYYLTSPLIRKFLEYENPPKEMVLLVQKEVAERICAKPGKMSLLAVAVQFYSQPKKIFNVSKNSFWPKPKVDSALIKISNIKRPIDIDIEKFFKVVKAGFSSPRKQLINNLSKGLKIKKEIIQDIFKKLNIDFKIRAEALSVEEWKRIAKNIN